MALNLEHAPIGAVHRHQLLMGAHFSNPAVCDEKDPVAEAGGRKPVRNEERGFIACQRICILIRVLFLQVGSSAAVAHRARAPARRDKGRAQAGAFAARRRKDSRRFYALA